MSPPQQFMEIEPEMLAMETIVPVYFAVEDEALLSIYEQTQAASASQGSASAAEGALGRGQGCAVPPRGCCLRASMWRPSSSLALWVTVLPQICSVGLGLGAGTLHSQLPPPVPSQTEARAPRIREGASHLQPLSG